MGKRTGFLALLFFALAICTLAAPSDGLVRRAGKKPSVHNKAAVKNKKKKKVVKAKPSTVAVVIYVPTVVPVTQFQTSTVTIAGVPVTKTETQVALSTTSIPVTTTQVLTQTDLSVTVATVSVPSILSVPTLSIASVFVPTTTTLIQTQVSVVTQMVTVVSTVPAGRPAYVAAATGGPAYQLVAPRVIGTSSQSKSYTIKPVNDSANDALSLFSTANTNGDGNYGPSVAGSTLYYRFRLADPTTAAATSSDFCVIGYDQSNPVPGITSGSNVAAYYMMPWCSTGAFQPSSSTLNYFPWEYVFTNISADAASQVQMMQPSTMFSKYMYMPASGTGKMIVANNGALTIPGYVPAVLFM